MKIEMKSLLLGLVVVLTWGWFCGFAEATYFYNVDDATGGPMHLDTLDYTVNFTGSRVGTIIFQDRATNTGEIRLIDIGIVWQFSYYESNPMTFENSSHTWQWNNDVWISIYGVNNQYDLLSMDRGVTDVPLEWNGATLIETDEAPVIWIGDIGPGDSIDFDYMLGFDLSGFPGGTYQFMTVGFFVSTVPEPSTLLLLGLGGMMLRRRKSA